MLHPPSRWGQGPTRLVGVAPISDGETQVVPPLAAASRIKSPSWVRWCRRGWRQHHRRRWGWGSVAGAGAIVGVGEGLRRGSGCMLVVALQSGKPTAWKYINRALAIECWRSLFGSWSQCRHRVFAGFVGLKITLLPCTWRNETIIYGCGIVYYCRGLVIYCPHGWETEAVHAGVGRCSTRALNSYLAHSKFNSIYTHRHTKIDWWNSGEDYLGCCYDLVSRELEA